MIIIADDFGIAPGVNKAILALLSDHKIDGTSCMMNFDIQPKDIGQLRLLQTKQSVLAGIHLVLTDQKPLTETILMKDQRLPNFARLLLLCALKPKATQHAIHTELDAQLQRYREQFDCWPDFIDGHQHIHLLPPVAGWIAKQQARSTMAKNPCWIRGRPKLETRFGVRIALKTLFLRLLSFRFEKQLKAADCKILKPLIGFYDWRDFSGVNSAFSQFMSDQNASVMMCHPGHIDETLVARDVMVSARQAEYEWLAANDPRHSLSETR